jgi:hypothetical protein
MSKVYVGNRGAGKSYNLVMKYKLYKDLGYEPKMIVQSQDQKPLYLKQGVDAEDIIPILQLVQDNGWIKVARNEKCILIFDDILYTLGKMFKCPILASIDSSDISDITKKSVSVTATYDYLVDRAKHGPVSATIFTNTWEDITILYEEEINEIYYVHQGKNILITPKDTVCVE